MTLLAMPETTHWTHWQKTRPRGPEGPLRYRLETVACQVSDLLHVTEYTECICSASCWPISLIQARPQGAYFHPARQVQRLNSHEAIPQQVVGVPLSLGAFDVNLP